MVLPGCDLFNLSAPDYIDEYTSNASAERWEFITSWDTAPNNGNVVIAPATAENPAVLSIRLRNPRQYSLVYTVEVKNTDGTYGTAAADFAAAEAERYDRVLIKLFKAKIRDTIQIRLSFRTTDGLRTFESYEVPLIHCNTPPEAAENLSVTLSGSYPLASWTMNVSGDHDDVEKLVIRYREKEGSPIADEYSRLGETLWRNASGKTITYDTQSETYSILFPMPQAAGSSLTDHYNFSVTLYDGDGFSAEAATPGFGLSQAPLVSIETVSEDNDARTAAVGLTAAADKIWYKVNAGTTLQYWGPFTVDAGDEVTAWSTKTGCTESEKNKSLILVYGSVFIDPVAGIDSDPGEPRRGWFPGYPVQSVNTGIGMLNSKSVRDGALYLMGTWDTVNPGMGSGGLVEIIGFSGSTLKVRGYGGATVLDAENSGRVLYIDNSSASVTLKDLIIKNGKYENGGGIYLASGTLTVEDCTVLDNSAVAPSFGSSIYGGGIYISAGGNLTLQGNTLIKNNKLSDSTSMGIVSGYGGGIYVGSGGAAVIQGNTTIEDSAFDDGGGSFLGIFEGNGAGMYIDTGGSLTVQDNSVIQNNRFDIGSGGGIYLGNNGTLIIQGNASIWGNNATYGGGVYVWGNQSSFIMRGGTIGGYNSGEGNTSSGGGGGLEVAYGQFRMEGDAKIIGNKTTAQGGGGIHLSQGASFTMTGNTLIEKNEAPQGGGVNNPDTTTFTMTGGIIRGNIASTNGGGVATSSHTTSGFTMSGSALIESNTALRGGGVYMTDPACKFTMTGGTIRNHTLPAGSGGGGLYISEGTFAMSGSAVIENNSAVSGGGVYMHNNGSVFTMTGGTIRNHILSSGADGGGVHMNDGAFTMSGSAVIDNNSAGFGGGLYIGNGNFTMTGGTIKNNSAVGGGGGICANQNIHLGAAAYIPLNDVYLSSLSRIEIISNLTGNPAAVITPDAYSRTDPVLEGSGTLVQDNYRRFSVSRDGMTPYYLDVNGKLTTASP
ncbi:right-handed parallel beta-helix repeat-containing protein [Breznakiella homolactica]|uniref:Right-handed parallel beta-helix repeat-containing protein n=1 Tax=Breznakiella homolactica TaxID=2798577 RepID=A0A7T7XNK8_9SPIR|nr:right-handed parallel beta-helix repeat-containing protein [Breznakiella homolactica]QQO09660.1 right-handed parallel beta-helix repeat-containing protein [Breznakiella homolactica]